MCVIVVQKDKFPGWDILRNCWNRNPHGAGYMYQKNDMVIVSKGYTNFRDFKESVQKVENYEHIPMVYHFRIASHGNIVPENTHPFPLTSKINYMKALDYTCGCAIAHNGIISSRMYNESIRKQYDLTDTSEFIREITAIATTNGYTSKKEVSAALKIESRLSGSRFVMMDGASVKTFGKFYKINGCLFSNNFSHIRYEYIEGGYGD